MFNEICVSLLRQDKLYMLSMHDDANVYDENVCETRKSPHLQM
jgi:hypothetical protein